MKPTPTKSDSISAKRCRSTNVIILFWVPLVSGCQALEGELLIQSRPSTGTEENRVYMIHAGDRPVLRFKPSFLDCDYAILHDGSTGQYHDCGRPLREGFDWPHTFSRPAEETVILSVTGYAQEGSRDYMPSGDKVLEIGLPEDPTDRAVAEASVSVRVFQTEVDMTVRPQWSEPLWELSRMTLSSPVGGRIRVRYSDSPDPELRGFTVDGPDGQGNYRIRYTPRLREISITRPTTIELLVPDKEARTETFEAVLELPYSVAETTAIEPLEGSS